MPSLLQLADLDSNQDKQNQNLLCYRYTIGQGPTRTAPSHGLASASCWQIASLLNLFYG